MWLKEVLVRAEDSCTSNRSSLLHGFTQLIGLVQSIEIGLEKLSNNVATQVISCGEYLGSFNYFSDVGLIGVFYSLHLF